MRSTPNKRLATIVLGEDVGDWLIRRREDVTSWYALADALAVATNQQVVVTHETVRQWHTAAKEARECRTAPSRGRGRGDDTETTTS